MKVNRMLSALVVFGMLMVAIWLWAAMTDLDSSRAMAPHADSSTPVAMPAPLPPHEAVMFTRRIGNSGIAQNAQPAAIPAPAYSK